MSFLECLGSSNSLLRLYLGSLYFNEKEERKLKKEGDSRFYVHNIKYKKGGYIVRKIVEDNTFDMIVTTSAGT